MVATVFFVLFEHAIVVSNVYLNGAGPYRMVIDTGAQSSSVTPETAAEIGLRPEFRVEQVSLAGSRMNPGGYVTVDLAGATERAVETIICDLPAIRVLGRMDGVLGQSWLQRFNYEIDYRRLRLTLNGTSPAGDRISFRWKDGRPAISVWTDHGSRWMLLDSGAPAVVLFGRRQGSGRLVRLHTSAGTTVADRDEIRLQIPSAKTRRMAAVLAPARTADEGLLPLQMFASVYINNREGYVILRER